ncbi:MAG TPA: hypothetical protein VGN20_19205 [Mucilaginibacter sp.]|jgi:hypothetical protein
MNLGFKQQINGKPTFFPEKIIAGIDLYDHQKMTLNDSLGDVINPTDDQWDAGSCNPLFEHQPKLHTIREDKHNRWKAGNLIHFGINIRTPNYLRFAPVTECKSVQQFEIIYYECIDPGEGELFEIKIDGRVLNMAEQITLAINDGFENLGDFLEFFNKDFTGKIIHWTDLKY